MKKIHKLCALALVCALFIGVSSCGNDLHNGTEMTISKVEITGLPTDVYANVDMMFSYIMPSGDWVHDTPGAQAANTATVNATGTYELNFSPALEFQQAQLQFLLIDTATDWDNKKIDTKHSGKDGGDVTLANMWSGIEEKTVLGVVDGDNVNWSFKDSN
ncbi:MAG TPA: hypothetical protein VFC68_07860 [Treponemataceae bacterium]|nr:hypothetical protein [Treponemataceae bacterium]